VQCARGATCAVFLVVTFVNISLLVQRRLVIDDDVDADVSSAQTRMGPASTLIDIRCFPVFHMISLSGC
jgi:hypothetical protein